MAPFLDEIAARLSTQSVASSSGEGGWYLWLGRMPDSTAIADKAVALIETAGFPWAGAPDVRELGLQVTVRGNAANDTSTTYEDAEQRAMKVKSALHQYSGSSETQSVHYVGIWAESGPLWGGWDADQRPYFSLNFRCVRSTT